MCGSVGKENSVAGVDEGGRIVQGDLPVNVVLVVSMFFIELLVFKGVCVVFLSTGDRDVEGERMGVCVDQGSEQGMGLTCNGCMKCSGDLPDKGGLKDMWLIVKGEV